MFTTAYTSPRQPNPISVRNSGCNFYILKVGESYYNQQSVYKHKCIAIGLTNSHNDVIVVLSYYMNAS